MNATTRHTLVGGALALLLPALWGPAPAEANPGPGSSGKPAVNQPNAVKQPPAPYKTLASTKPNVPVPPPVIPVWHPPHHRGFSVVVVVDRPRQVVVPVPVLNNLGMLSNEDLEKDIERIRKRLDELEEEGWSIWDPWSSELESLEQSLARRLEELRRRLGK